MTSTRNIDNPLDTLQEIRSIMERSSRFISLSGLSGVTAGLFALLGGAMAYIFLGHYPFEGGDAYYSRALELERWGMNALTFFSVDAAFTLAGALAGAVYFTTRKARRKGDRIWDALTQRLLINLAIPLAAGGLFILALYGHGLIGLIAPATLIFYGLSLINASKYTFDDIRYLGLCQLALGLAGSFFPGYGLELWILGFGVLHITYGIIMYRKYEISSDH